MMKRLVWCLIAALILLSSSLAAAGFNDPARRFIRVTSVPASCTTGDVFVNVGVSPAVYYNCPVATPVVFGVATPVTAANGGTGQSTYTKGDLLAAPGGATLNKLAVGTDAQVLTADAASTNGVKWAAAASSGLATDGSTNGATAQKQIFNTGVQTGDGSATIGQLILGNSANLLVFRSQNTTTAGVTRPVNLVMTGPLGSGGMTLTIPVGTDSLVTNTFAAALTNKTLTDAATGGATPAVSSTTANSCGTTAATITGNNTTGVITVGATAGTNCTITFTVAAPTRRQCTVTNETTANLSRSTYLTTTTSTVEGTFVAGDLISYVCAVY